VEKRQRNSKFRKKQKKYSGIMGGGGVTGGTQMQKERGQSKARGPAYLKGKKTGVIRGGAGFAGGQAMATSKGKE